MFHYALPGHSDYNDDDPTDARAGRRRCAVCRRIAGARDHIVIAGVPVHLSCALERRRAAGH